MASLLPLLATISRWVKADFVRKTRRVSAVQGQFLLTLLRHHQSTQLGQELGLDKIQTIDQFWAQVPI